MPKGYKKQFFINDTIDYKGLEFDYMTIDISSDDGVDDTRLSMYEAIRHLTDVERKIFLTYVELGTYVKTAEVFRVNPATVKAYITNVRNKISKYMEDNK